MRRSITRAAALATLLAATLVAATVVGPVAPGGTAHAAASAAAAIDRATPAELFAGGLYRDADTLPAQATRRAEAEGRTATAAALREISSQAIAVWVGPAWTGDYLATRIARYRAAAAAQGRTLVLVTYAIPNRDCGGYSAGGLTSQQYAAWNRTIADGLRGSRAVVLVEPDSIAMLSNTRCGDEAARRLPLLRSAVDTLADAGLTVYLDGGKGGWVAPEVMAPRLAAAGVSRARGFFTNVANFARVDTERAYGERLSTLLGGKHFVVDVSRNGAGPRGGWCNPDGAALGQRPHAAAGTTHLDALLWVKTPGVSDGSCGGAPAAGAWYESYALQLVRNRR
jgi:endoglucanase